MIRPDRKSAGRDRIVVATVVGLVVGATIGVFVLGSYLSPCQDPTGSRVASTVAAPPTVWDEQVTLSFSAHARALFTNASISAEADSNGYGPAFLLNGATDTGYWYQVGVTYNWGRNAPVAGHDVGFELVAAVFAPGHNGTPQYEYLESAPLSDGETVQLGLTIQGACVAMSWKTPDGLATVLTYDAHGTSGFVNDSPSKIDAPYVTSLMTEWWHVAPYYGPTARATYTLPHLSGSYVGMGISERIPTYGGPLLFSNATQAHLGCGCVTTLNFQNVTASVSPVEFTTD
jgi:hypothetical protein